MRVLAVIPARGGSKGIPRKNLRPFAGKPLLVWSVEAAFASALITDVVVSSDDPEILALARTALQEAQEAEERALEAVWTRHRMAACLDRREAPGRPTARRWRALERPAELATDEAPTDPVLIHALEECGPADVVVLLQPTSPLRRRGLVDAVVAATVGADSAFTAVPGHFGWQLVCGEMRCTAPRRPRRQDMAPEERLWLEDGSVFACRARGLVETGQRLHGHIAIVETDPRDLVDLDDPWQWAEAESLWERRWRAGEDALTERRLRALAV